MKLRSAHISNFRSIPPDGLQLSFGRFTSIVGPNDSGKTSILLALLGALWVLTNDKRMQHYNEWSQIFNLENRFDDDIQLVSVKHLNVEIQFEFSDMEIQLMLAPLNLKSGLKSHQLLTDFPIVFSVYLDRLLNSDQTGRDFLNGELMGASHWINIERTMELLPSELAKRDVTATHKLLESLCVKESWEWMSKYEIIWINANRSAHFQNYSSNAGRDEAKILSTYFIEREPGELVKLVDALALPNRKREYRKFIQYIQMVIPDLSDVRLRPDSLGRSVYVQRHGREQPLYRSGAGITNVLYLCGRILQAAQAGEQYAGSIVIVDEPETGLHADFHRRLMDLGKRVYQDHGVQWVLSTHSPYLLMGSLSEEDELVLTQLNGGRTSVAEIKSDEDTRVMYEAIGFYLPSILNAQGVIFVEGPSEATFLNEILPRIEIYPSKEGLVIVPLGGDQIAYIEPEMLSRVHPRTFVWIDSELNGQGDELSAVRKKFEGANGQGIAVFIDKSVRSLENCYPMRALENVYKCSETPNIGPYTKDIWRCLEDMGCTRVYKNKPKLARAVAKELTVEEIQELSIVQELRKWINASNNLTS